MKKKIKAFSEKQKFWENLFPPNQSALHDLVEEFPCEEKIYIYQRKPGTFIKEWSKKAMASM